MGAALLGATDSTTIHREFGGRITAVRAFLIGLLFVQALPAAGAPDTHYNDFTTFDRHFAKYSKRYFGAGFDWRYFKAQAIAESGLQVDVRSRVGAVGLMQVMPRTFEEIRQRNPEITGGWISPAGTSPPASGATGRTSSSGGHHDRVWTSSSSCSRPTTQAGAMCYGPSGSRLLTARTGGCGRQSRSGFLR